MNPTDQNNQDEDYNTNQPNNQPNGQPTSLDNSTDSTQSFNQPSPNSQSPNINISGPNIQTSSPKMPSMNFGRPETNQANPSFQSSPGIPPKKSKKGLVIVLIILLLITIAGASYYFLVASKNNTQPNQQANSKSTDQDQLNTETGELVKTTYQVSREENTDPMAISVEHPKSWKVEKSEDNIDTDGFVTAGDLRIISPKGNMLLITDVSRGGFGGDCSEDINITVIKKIKTKEANYIFSEYKSNSDLEGGSTSLSLEKIHIPSSENEQYGIRNEDVIRYNNLKEGETYEGDCRVAIGYPHIGDLTTYVETGLIKVEIFDSNFDQNYANAENYYKTYDQIKDDTDFIAMLQSLEIVKE